MSFTEIQRVRRLINRISLPFMGQAMFLEASYDKKVVPLPGQPERRVYIQISYRAINSHTGEEGDWKGAKWYLSQHMTNDEIVKKCYLAFRTCVEHEVLESFKVDGKAIFNPHIDFEELIKISEKEVKRSQNGEV